MIQALTDPRVIDAIIISAIFVVGVGFLALIAVWVWRRFSELSGHGPRRRP